MTRATPHDNLAFFAESSFCFDRGSTSAWLMRNLRARGRAKIFEACAFIESLLWLEFGVRHRLFDPFEAHRFARSQFRTGRLLGWRSPLDVAAHLRYRVGWPARSHVEKLEHFLYRRVPGEAEGDVAVEEVLTGYWLEAEPLMGARRFQQLTECVSLDPRSPEAAALQDTRVKAAEVAAALREEVRHVPRGNPVMLVAGFIEFATFTSSLFEHSIEDAEFELAQTRRRALAELIGIQFWRMNLNDEQVLQSVESLVVLTERLAVEMAGVDAAGVGDAIGGIRVSLELWQRSGREAGNARGGELIR